MAQKAVALAAAVRAVGAPFESVCCVWWALAVQEEVCHQGRRLMDLVVRLLTDRVVHCLMDQEVDQDVDQEADQEADQEVYQEARRILTVPD